MAKDIKPGDKLKFTRKTVSFHFDNLWKRGVTAYYLPIIGITLNRDRQSVVIDLTDEYLYKNEGKSYKLSFNLVGLAAEVWWHRHNTKQTKEQL